MNVIRLVLVGFALAVSVAGFAQESTTIDISGAQIRNATNQSRSSSPGTISPAYLYEYHITGMARGSGGILGIMFPTPIPLAQMLEQLSPGSSAFLDGFVPNTSGSHPAVLLNQRIEGSQVLGGLTVTFGVNILIEINAAGNVSFSLTNVVLDPSILVGSVLITSGTVLVNRAPGVLTGIVDLQDFSGSITQQDIVFELRNPGSTTPVRSYTTQLFLDGRYILLTDLRGNYDLACKPSHWLRSVRSNLNITVTGLSGLDFSTVNGDADPDNEVNLVDFGALSAAFGSAPGDPNWNPSADLDGDLEVTLTDLGILSARFGQAGDE